jgi:3'-phosphoadenosine 5'-phosphosulfate sulfotransferase (PAPS reductase)/FAD synthetase
MLQRDENGVLHVVALSGGHDSTIMSFMLKEREPRPYNYVCTPTGDELPEMFDFWRWLGSDNALGRGLIPIIAGTLNGLIREFGALPNFQQRWCTRRLKIEPYREFLISQSKLGPVVSYVGLRADEEGRAGGAYSDIDGITMRFPLREWGMGETEVQAGLADRGIRCPNRTDCAKCYHQRLGEWWELWDAYPDLFNEAVIFEDETGHTFRTPGRDSWPSSLREMRERFERGDKPTISLNRMARERMQSGGCRVCSL